MIFCPVFRGALQGYLVLKEKPEKPTRIGKLIAEGKIDWDKTKVWGMGGYYGRIFFNVKGREPNGIIPKEEYENFIHNLNYLNFSF